MTARTARDRGTAAVEFALMVPVLLLILFGIIDFGRALNAQIELTGAAHEGVTLAAFGDAPADIQARVSAAAPKLSGVTTTITQACPDGAGLNQDAQVSVSYPFSFITPVGAIASAPTGTSTRSPSPR
jgi:Flp pilus assembly protein TadG